MKKLQDPNFEEIVNDYGNKIAARMKMKLRKFAQHNQKIDQLGQAFFTELK